MWKKFGRAKNEMEEHKERIELEQGGKMTEKEIQRKKTVDKEKMTIGRKDKRERGREP